MTNKDFTWLNEASLLFLERDYLLPGQEFTDRIRIIVDNFARLSGRQDIADKFLSYLKKGWYSLSTPVWTNYGTDRGLPISCFGSYIGDSMESILYGLAEAGMMSKYGGGTSGYFDLRARGVAIKNNGVSAGPFGFEQLFDLGSTVISQGNTRRGSFAAYMDIEHPDVLEHLAIREDGNPIQDLSFGVCVSDDFMQRMIDGDVEARKLWARVLQVRFNTGYPYIFWSDSVNKNTVDVYKDKQMKIWASNLCSEIALPANDDESFVCCLSSMNLLHYDDWKDTDAVEVLTWFLDSVMTEFIEKLEVKIASSKFYPVFMDRALNFARRHRALGVGALGWHSYLQSKMIPFESFEAKMLNVSIFKTINERTLAASVELAERFGEPELLIGYGRRNTCLVAVAPTKSSSFILGGVSEGIEPFRSNMYVKDLAKIKYTFKNPHLKELLVKYNKDNAQTWASIADKAGSVQHLDFLTKEEKDVFKTFEEISPKEIIIQASARQKYIDQSQSLNLMIHPKTPVKDLNNLMIEAWQLGVKTLYYQHSVNAAQEFARDLSECVSCSA